MKRTSWSRVPLVGLALILAFVATGCPGDGEGTDYEAATETVSGTVESSEQTRVHVTIEIDSADIVPGDRLVAFLSITPTPTTAVLGEMIVSGADSSGLELLQIQHPNEFGLSYFLDSVGLDLMRCPAAGLCTYAIDATVGNLGETAEEWTIAARVIRDATRDAEIEIPSLQIRIEDRRDDTGLWATTGPAPFDGEVDDPLAFDPVAFAVSVSTSITDRELFDVLITEPRHELVSRTVEAVIGPADLHWAPASYGPSAAPLSTQASCNADGCRIDTVAIFRPGYKDDWWIVAVVPKPDSMDTLVADNVVTIDVRPLGVATFEGELGPRTGSSALRMDAPATAPEAMVWWGFKPENTLGFQAGELALADGGELDHYRWFEFDCADRCRGKVTLSWQVPPDWWTDDLFGDLVYSGLVIGGEGRGIASQSPPEIIVTADR